MVQTRCDSQALAADNTIIVHACATLAVVLMRAVITTQLAHVQTSRLD